MKKLDTSNIIAGLRKLGAVKATFDHMMEAAMEPIADLIYGLLASENAPTALYGCINSGGGSTYNINAGSIHYNGEVFAISSFAGTASGADVPVLSIVTTWRGGDPVKYSDSNNYNTHQIRRMAWSFGASGSGIINFSALLNLAGRINQNLLNVPGQIASAINAVVDLAPGALDTLNELAAALGDDANFASTVTTALNARVLKAGDTMTGNLTVPAASAGGHAVNKTQLDAVETSLNSAKVPNGRTITAGSGLTGGGDLSADRTIDWNPDNVTLEVSADVARIKVGGISASLVLTDIATTNIVSGSMAAIDLNTIFRGGIFFHSGGVSSNGPTSDDYMVFSCYSGSLSAVYTQIAIRTSGGAGFPGRIHIRVFPSGGPWGAWGLYNDPTV